MVEKAEPTHEEVEQFVIAAHGNFAKAKEMLEANPALLNVRWPKTNETALEAAAHVGSSEIAKYLLSKGAPLDICTAAMLGMADRVKAFLQTDPSLAKSKGAHGIPVMFFAALSGQTKIAELLVAHEATEGFTSALQGAVRFGHKDMVQWLLSRGADVHVQDFEGKRPLRVAIEKGHNEIAELIRKHGGIE
jgi:ankyrin repeat protein